MKCLLAVFVACSALTHLVAEESAPPAASPLTTVELNLVFQPRFLKTDDHGLGYLDVEGEPLGASRVLVLSPWDLMELVQKLASVDLPLSRFGNGNGDELTQAWRLLVVRFIHKADRHPPVASEDPFDPALVLWDPGFIQTKNSQGQWTIRLERRDIVEGDLPTLSPLEVQQAVAVLTQRTYSTEFVLEHLEQFRSQLSIVPRAPTKDAHH